MFNCLQLVELIYGARCSSGAALSQEVGTRAVGTHGGLGAAQAERWESEPRHTFYLDLKLSI
jgi:hypothetical protein